MEIPNPRPVDSARLRAEPSRADLHERFAMNPETPIYRDCYDWTHWILGRFGDHTDVLSTRVVNMALDVMLYVNAAVRSRGNAKHLKNADARLAGVRTLLRLAAEQGLLTDDQLGFALQSANNIGRQIGGWLKSMPQVS